MRPRFVSPVLCALLAACAATAPAPVTQPVPAVPVPAARHLDDAELSRFLDDAGAWALLDARNADGSRIDALFGAGVKLQLKLHARAEVHGGCNQLFGPFKVSEGHVRIGPLAATRMACEPPRLEADSAIARLLEGRLAVTANGPAPADMQLTTAAGQRLLFTRVTVAP